MRRNDVKLMIEEPIYTEARHLPIIKHFAKRINLVDTIDRLVGHSSAHDKRRHKRIDRPLADKRQKLDKHCKEVTAKSFFCLADAQVAAEKLHAVAKNGYHSLQLQIDEKATYGRGRPANGQTRVPQGLPVHCQL